MLFIFLAILVSIFQIQTIFTLKNYNELNRQSHLDIETIRDAELFASLVSKVSAINKSLLLVSLACEAGSIHPGARASIQASGQMLAFVQDKILKTIKTIYLIKHLQNQRQISKIPEHYRLPPNGSCQIPGSIVWKKQNKVSVLSMKGKEAGFCLSLYSFKQPHWKFCRGELL